MTLEEFNNLKVGDTIYYLLTGISRGEYIIENIDAGVILISNKEGTKLMYDRFIDYFFINEKEYKIAYIKRRIIYNQNIDEYSDFIKENVEYFI